MMRPLIWPDESHQETTLLIRLGRAWHWFFTGCAMIIAVGALTSAYMSQRNAEISKEAHERWMGRHHPKAEYDKNGAPMIMVTPSDEIDPEPYVASFQPADSMFVLAFGVILFLVGRGGRYIIAGE